MMNLLFEVTNICFVLLSLSGNLGCADVVSLFQLHIFFCLFSFPGGCISIWRFTYFMFKVDVMIANMCFVLLCLSGNGGCAGVTERRQLHIFFIFFPSEVGVPPSEGFHISCLRLMLWSLRVAVCWSLFQKTLPVLMLCLCFGFIFFLFVFLPRWVYLHLKVYIFHV